MSKISDLAEELAQEFINSDQTQYVGKWDITFDDADSGEDVVVIVFRGGGVNTERLRETFRKSITSVATLPSGNTCPCCHGSGRS